MKGADRGKGGREAGGREGAGGEVGRAGGKGRGGRGSCVQSRAVPLAAPRLQSSLAGSRS